MTHKSQAVCDAICEQIADGKSLRSICAQEGMPSKVSVLYWLQNDPEFAERYTLARQQAADSMAEQLQDLSQRALDKPEEANAIRVAADILKWTASKLKPKLYGDRVEQHVISETQSPDEVERRIKQLEAELVDLQKQSAEASAEPTHLPTTRPPVSPTIQ